MSSPAYGLLSPPSRAGAKSMAPGGRSTRRRRSRIRRARQTRAGQGAARPTAAHRAHRHAGREPPGDLWSLFDFLNPGLLGSAKEFPAFVKRLATGRRTAYGPLRAPGAALHPAAAEDRQARHRRPARQDRGEGLLPLSPSAGRALPASGRRTGRRAGRASKASSGKGFVLAFLMRFKQICNHPVAMAGRRRLRAGRQRQVRPPARDLRGDRRAAGEGAGLHAVPRDRPSRWRRSWRASSAARAWCCTAARRSASASELVDAVPARRRPAVFRAVAQGRRHRA